ncbi:hypothetical protein ACGTJS_05100 [Faucicola mancuniensis]|uniref:hypothetical protein n=1 Tax=Faucicola mancuniensis TaxID=1309795 RepID=UPI00397748C8
MPKNVLDLVVNKDWDTLKEELLKCEPMAYQHFGAGNSLKAKHILFVCGSGDIKANHFDFNDKFWQSLLNYYISMNQTDVVKVLLEKGFDPNLNDDLENKLNQLEQFELKLYELMQFEPQ